eukprot:Nk52_evm100s1073 gene=Nk52_evmTU100s1073
MFSLIPDNTADDSGMDCIEMDSDPDCDDGHGKDTRLYCSDGVVDTDGYGFLSKEVNLWALAASSHDVNAKEDKTSGASKSRKQMKEFLLGHRPFLHQLARFIIETSGAELKGSTDRRLVQPSIDCNTMLRTI